MAENSTSKEHLLSSGSTVSERLSMDRLLQRAEQLGPALTIRELRGEHGFGASVSCKPGVVTVLDAKGNAALREALSASGKSSTVSLRFGTRELYPSEIHLVGSASYKAVGASTREALLNVGAPARVVEHLLSNVGLSASADAAPRSLSDDARFRLNICASLFSAAKVVVFDKPLEKVSEEWLEPIAHLLVDGAQTTLKVFVVMNSAPLPPAWKKNPRVVQAQFKSVETSDREFTHRAETEHMLTSMRSMLDTNRDAPEDASYIVTRPLTLNVGRGRQATGEALTSEMIRNPSLPHAESEEVAGHAPSEHAGTKRPTKGNDLTRVSLIRKLVRDSAVVRFFARMKYKLRGMIPKSTLEEESQWLLGAEKAKRSMKNYMRQIHIRNGLFVPMLVVVFSLFLLQLVFAGLVALFG